MRRKNIWKVVGAILLAVVMVVGIVAATPLFPRINTGVLGAYQVQVWVDDDFTPDTPGWGITHFDKIQDGIDAVSGSTVHVAAGTYYENITLKDGVALRGANPNTTIIDGSGTGSVVSIPTGVDSATVLDGFTITNGDALSGGAIHGASVGDCSPNIMNCIIVGNTASSAGGGIFFNYETSRPTITACKIINNTTTGSPGNGGGIALHNSVQALVSDCLIRDNQAIYGGGIFVHSYLPGTTYYTTIANCIIIDNTANWGGGLSIDSDTVVINCTLVGNGASSGGGIWCQNLSTTATVKNNIVVNSTSGSGIYCYNVGSYESLTVDYNNVWGNTGGNYGGDISAGGGEISADPLFFDVINGDYHLQHCSPCIDTGNNTGAPTADIDGNPRPIDGDGDTIAVTDMGAYEYVPIPFMVTNTDDSGSGSLRQAILDANASPGTDTITFSICAEGPHTIQPLSPLPEITDPVIIDGYTQPGASPNTNGPGLGINAVLTIELDGSNAGAGVDGLHIHAGSSMVRGLVINRFSGHGIMLEINGGNVIEGNFIGPDIAGTAAFLDSNQQSGVIIEGIPNNTIGGTSPEARNLISGNRCYSGASPATGVRIVGSGATGNLVQGNFIGTDVTGTVALGNSPGVHIEEAPDNTVGGTTPEARNIISGNDGWAGVRISEHASNNLVQGNFIGTDVTGTLPLGNIGWGVWIIRAEGNRIGGTELGARNIVSGNQGGVILSGGANRTVVQGNFIGIDVTGTVDLGNHDDGIRITAHSNTVGGTETGTRNVISGNDECGVGILSGGRLNVIQGNFIGTDITGTVDLGNSVDGVLINDKDNTIGGNTAEARNVISGNDGCGVEVIGESGNQVQGNFIGTDVTGVAPLGNNSHGVLIRTSEGNHNIGGMADEGNTIAFNSGDGVFAETGTKHAILSNSIFSNGGLGIDLDEDDVTPNDPGDSDSGSNNLQNFPVLTSATTGSSITIEGTLNSTASTDFRLEFFSNSVCDPSGYGEGETFLGSIDVTTDGSGDVSFAITFPDTVPVGYSITATATDPDGNTSEFSECIQVIAAP